jgi:hypothetical protein
VYVVVECPGYPPSRPERIANGGLAFFQIADEFVSQFAWIFGQWERRDDPTTDFVLRKLSNGTDLVMVAFTGFETFHNVKYICSEQLCSVYTNYGSLIMEARPIPGSHAVIITKTTVMKQFFEGQRFEKKTKQNL